MITLVPFTSADIPTLVSWIPDATMLLQWAGPTLDWPLTAEQLERNLKSSGPGTSHLIYRVNNLAGEHAGHIEIKSIDPVHSNAMIGKVLIAPAFRGQGLALPLMNAVLKICFDDLKLHRVGLRVFAQNTGAISTYKRAGFVAEGLDREVRRTPDGTWWNACTMGILEHEWLDQKRRAALQPDT
ncbi:MAG: GNAT family N-acetyltransferase [Rhodospirillaceae bacterium]|nr:GNAT family N-acetyltransferase [Rhodospirillaceae bacterium]